MTEALCGVCGEIIFEPDTDGQDVCERCFRDAHRPETGVADGAADLAAMLGQDPPPDEDGAPPYVQIDVPHEALVRCQRCGCVIEGDVAARVQHNVWHAHLEQRLAATMREAKRWKMPPRY